MKLDYWLHRKKISLEYFLKNFNIKNYLELQEYCLENKIICPKKEEVGDVFEKLHKSTKPLEKRTDNNGTANSSTTKSRNSKRRSADSNSARGSETRTDKSKSSRRSSRKRKKDNEVESIHKRSKSESND